MCRDNIGSNFNNNPRGEIQLQMQIGSELFPEYPLRSRAEAHYQLKTCLGVQASALHNVDIQGIDYRDNEFIIGFDSEKVLEAGWTGLNTRAGDLLVIKLKYLQGVTDEGELASRTADRMHIVLHSDQILEIRDTGCTVFD